MLNIKKNVSFDDIYAVFEFDKNLKNIVLKNYLEIEITTREIAIKAFELYRLGIVKK